MRDRERNQLDAAQATYDYLLQPENVLIWTPLEAFGEAVVKVEGSLGILHTLIQIQAGKTEGITLDKKRLKESLQRRLLAVAKAAISFGKAQNNSDLVAQAEALNSQDELDRISTSLLDDHAQMLYERILEARDAAPAIAGKYGLKTGLEDKLLDPLLSAILAYGAVVQSPRSAIIRRAGARAGIEAELRRLQSIFKDDLDNLIVQFEDDHAGFVRDYFNSRKIIDRGGGGGKGEPPAPANP
ncbi:MAG TPA: hypothetical protein VK474_09905 [Chthoniobacterales bacterium]|nr:hypothetical protein [Chthoniobacterales bacterium]